MSQNQRPQSRYGAGTLRDRLFHIVFYSDTWGGRLFDVLLIGAIILSVIVVMFESVAKVRAEHGDLLLVLEWSFTVLFTVEYIIRLWISPSRRGYATSFFGVIDLMAIVPTYLSLFLPGAQFLLVIRLLRILRIFRILKLVHYLSEATELAMALRSSRRKITVFIFTVLTLVVILGSLMYLIEGGKNGFTSIPKSVYWAIVTLTTVGYGDISPTTNLGQTLAAMIMILGYGIIAVPTGIVTVEINRAREEAAASQRLQHDPLTGITLPGSALPVVEATECAVCGLQGHAEEARYCRRCGARLGGEFGTEEV